MKKDARITIILRCEECKEENYITSYNKKNHTEKLNLNKFCSKCNKQTAHKQKK